MFEILHKLAMDPLPLRVRLWRGLLRRMAWAPYEIRLDAGAVERPPYGYCLYHAADLARRLGLERISALEFGVARGSGLLALEQHAAEVRRRFGIDIEIYGFDSGAGLPQAADYRDFPNWIQVGRFQTEGAELQNPVLESTRLVVGNVAETVPTFFAKFKPAPVACVFFDLVLYSSTLAALKLFDADEQHFLPRIFCYFDDIIGSEKELYSDFTGARLAIREFNDAHVHQKISPTYHLVARAPDVWHQKIFVRHDFQHPRYDAFVG
jgi:hypothetical protein